MNSPAIEAKQYLLESRFPRPLDLGARRTANASLRLREASQLR
jgi:hypothetical protein